VRSLINKNNKNKFMKNTKFVQKFVLGLSVVAAVVFIIGTPMATFAATLTRTLGIGSTGTDVSSLQSFLGQDPTMYPANLVTGYYGNLTSAAVQVFQGRNSIAMVGYVGPATLAALNTQMALASNGGPAATIANISVAPGRTSAVISWNTNESARGMVYYSTSPLVTYEHYSSVDSSGTIAATDLNFVTSQNVSLANLMPNTTYYYMIYTTDMNNNVSVSWPTVFSTKN